MMTALGLSPKTTYHSGAINLKDLVRLFTSYACECLGLGPGPADITLLSTERDWTFDSNATHSKGRNSPFGGEAFRDGPVATIISGRVVRSTGEDIGPREQAADILRASPLAGSRRNLMNARLFAPTA